jgi:hypothetical protein
LAVVASRSSLAAALLSSVVPIHRHSVVEFLSGLSLDELECLADFEGALTLETSLFGENGVPNAAIPYRLLPLFFDHSTSERWQNSDDRAHKTFIALAWLEYRSKRVRISSVRATRG